MPPPYLVDIDGHPHPLKSQRSILELIRPPTALNYNKKEEVEALVGYDEFMKQRQVQLATGSKQLANSIVNLVKHSDSNCVHQNNRDTCDDDQPCCSNSSSSQSFVQSQDSSVTMETNQTDKCTLQHINCRTKEVDCINSCSEKSTINNSLSNGDVEHIHNAENGFEVDNSVNGHPTVTTKQETTAIDHQTCRNSDQGVDFDQDEQIHDQAVVKDGVSVNGDVNFVSNQQQINDHSAVTVDQAVVNDHTASDQSLVNNQAAVNDNNDDEINIIEFENSDEPGGATNSNVLTSIVWSCGLSDEEAKNAVSLWMSRTIIPRLDLEVYG